LNTSRY